MPEETCQHQLALPRLTICTHCCIRGAREGWDWAFGGEVGKPVEVQSAGVQDLPYSIHLYVLRKWRCARKGASAALWSPGRLDTACRRARGKQRGQL